jgi:hypothetical protein
MHMDVKRVRVGRRHRLRRVVERWFGQDNVPLMTGLRENHAAPVAEHRHVTVVRLRRGGHGQSARDDRPAVKLIEPVR